MLATKVQKAATVWPTVAHVVYVPHTESEYQEAVSLLDNLIDEVGENELTSAGVAHGGAWRADREVRGRAHS